MTQPHPLGIKPKFPPLRFASSSTVRRRPPVQTHGPSLRRTQLWPSLLLPLSRHRQTRDPRPRRRRNIRLFAIHERRGFGTGEVTGKYRYRHERRRVCCWYFLRQEVWGFDHSLEQQRGTHETGKPHSLDLFDPNPLSLLRERSWRVLVTTPPGSHKTDASRPSLEYSSVTIYTTSLIPYPSQPRPHVHSQ